MAGRTLWAIHAGKTGDAEPLFASGFLGLGWKTVGDLTSAPKDRAVFKSRLSIAFPETKEAGIAVWAGQLYRFVHELNENDIVAFFSKKDQMVRFARVDGGYTFASEPDATYPHRRKVTWVHAEPRATFSKEAMSELGSALSFFKVKNHVQEFAAVLTAQIPGVVFRGLEENEMPRRQPPVAQVFDGPRQLFTETRFTVADILSDIDLGDLGLPHIQRPFVWKARRVRELFDSMFQGYPVGHLLFWATTDSSTSRAIGAGEKHKTPSRVIVDGQQRLTSLYAVIKGKPVLDESYQPVRLEIAFRPRDARFEVADAAVKKDPEFIPNISELWAPGANAYTVISAFLNSLRATRELTKDDERAVSENLGRLMNLTGYPFTALEISSAVNEEVVSNIFVRINSDGVQLDQADFILTLLSVFWDQGRVQLETFSRDAQRPPAATDSPSPFNQLIQPSPDQLLRVAVAYGFHRGRLKSVYQLLRGKDLETGVFSPARREEQFAKLSAAQAQVLDLKHWHLFLGAVLGAGFRSSELISSETALLYTYALYLLGKLQCHVDEHRLQRVIGRWFFANSLTGHYSNSPETEMDSDLSRVKDLHTADAFVNALEDVMASTLTKDFWDITLPMKLETSAARSPVGFAFYAAQSLLSAPVLFSHKPIAALLDPSIRSTKKALERHHLFPRKWLESNGTTDAKAINQVANLALVEWPDNISIGKHPPSKYVPALRERFTPVVWDRMQRLHALPAGWENLDYEDFLDERRAKMAQVIRRGFESLGSTEPEVEPVDGTAEERLTWSLIQTVELALRQMVDAKYRTRWGQEAEAVMHKHLGDDAWKVIEKNREKHASQYNASPSGDRSIVDYTYLPQLTQMMMAGNAWELFRHLFKDKRQLEDLVRSVTPVRNDQAHFRTVPLLELRRCQVACEDLRNLLEKEKDSSGPSTTALG
jgi:hypothetical protein